MNRIAVMIMAAGQSARFGGCKQLAEIAGQPILQRAMDSAKVLCPNDVYLVTGHWHQQIDNYLNSTAQADIRVVYHPNWQQGLGSSIACGVEALGPGYDGVMILLADQVAITAEHLQRFKSGFDHQHIICSLYQQHRGVPALFPRHCFDALIKLQGDKGAKSLLYSDQYQQLEVVLPEAAIDIDTADELADYCQSQGGI